MTENREPKSIAICEHIKDNNSRCGSPALNGRRFCWHHSRLRSARRVNGKLKITIGALETYNSIEIALAQIVQAVIDDDIPATKANTLIRALRLAHTAIKSAYTPEKQPLDLPESMLDLLGESPISIVNDVNKEQTIDNNGSDTSHEAWKSGASAPRSDAAENGASAPVSPIPANPDTLSHHQTSHQPWKSGASAPRSDAAENGASAPVPADHPITRNPDSFASERSLRNGTGDDFLLREKRFTPDEIRAYWMQHVTDDYIRNLKDPGTKDYIFPAPTWLPLTEAEITHLKRHLPKSGIIPTCRENRNLRRLDFHEANQHYRPLTQDEMLTVPRKKPTAYNIQ